MTVSVPCRVRSVSVEPLIFVTVPVAPPQNAPAKPDVALENPLAHGKPKPPRPNDGGCCDGDPLGVGFAAAVVFARVMELARVTTKPAAAPTTAIATATPSNRSRPNERLGGASDGAGGGSQLGGSTFIGQEIPYRADLSKVLLTRQKGQTSGTAAEP